MSKSPITGYGDNLTVYGTRIGDLSPNDHENIEKERGGFNYKPLENVVVSHVQDSSTLICRKPSKDNIEDEEPKEEIGFARRELTDEEKAEQAKWKAQEEKKMLEKLK